MNVDDWRFALEGRYWSMTFDNTEFPDIKGPSSPAADLAKLPPPPVGYVATSSHSDSTARNHQAKKHRMRNVARSARRIDVNVRFGVHACFPPYNSQDVFPWGNTAVSLADASKNRALQGEVVWELSVVGFRLDFLMLDRRLRTEMYDRDEQTAAERESAICAIWNGDGVIPMWQTFPEDIDPFSSRTKATREIMIKRMANILVTWSGGELALQQYLRRGQGNERAGVARASFADFEDAVFRFYITTFTKTMNRLPTIPYCQPESLKRYGGKTG